MVPAIWTIRDRRGIAHERAGMCEHLLSPHDRKPLQTVSGYEELMTVRPIDQLSAGKSFFSAMGLDVRHFAAIWHIHKIGQLMMTDLNDLCGAYGTSLADFHVLRALLMEAPKPLRATDLAYALNVSNSALSKHVNTLAALDLLVCSPSLDDKRTKLLTITKAGRVKVEQIGRELEEHGRFAAHFRRLSAEDQEHLDRIASLLHTQMSRDFLPVTRGDP